MSLLLRTGQGFFATYSIWLIEGSKLWSPFAVSWELSEKPSVMQISEDKFQAPSITCRSDKVLGAL